MALQLCSRGNANSENWSSSFRCSLQSLVLLVKPRVRIGSDTHLKLLDYSTSIFPIYITPHDTGAMTRILHTIRCMVDEPTLSIYVCAMPVVWGMFANIFSFLETMNRDVKCVSQASFQKSEMIAIGV